MSRWPWLIVLAACHGATDDPGTTPDPLPLGIATTESGVTLAGAAVVDLTPVVTETFDDVDGNHEFSGCFDDPVGGTDDCPEGYDDADGNGDFDAVFIGGYGPMRPAQGVHDPITARAIVLEDGGEYVAFVVLDVVGLAHPRIDDASALLEQEGFDRDHLLVLSTHNHQGPDTMGLWGDPYGCISGDPDTCRSGFDDAFQQRITTVIVQAVKDAVAAMEPVTITRGAVNLRDVSSYYNGSVFGGHNPTAKVHGMVHDIRDPVIVSDQLLVLQANGDSGTVFTWTSWSGHPEVRGGNNNELSADWPGVARKVLEDRYGGIAVHMPESLGGMQSALGGDIPLVDEAGEPVWDLCTADDVGTGAFACTTEGDPRKFDDGVPVPVWAEHDSWDFVRSHGFAIANAAVDVLEAADPGTALGTIRVMAEPGYVPIRNLAYNILGPMGIFDMGLDRGMQDVAKCPEAAEVTLGCLPFRVFRVQLGDVGFASAPGELLPELSWGLPTDDPQWAIESADPTKRGPESRYFPQHQRACDTVTFEECREVKTVGDCDCLSLHVWPFSLGDDGAAPVLPDLDTKYRAAISMTSTYLSYVLPEPDVHRTVSLLDDNDGDHYEDTVTPAYDFGSLYLKTWKRLQERWAADATDPVDAARRDAPAGR